MPALAEAAEGVDGEVGLLRGDGNDFRRREGKEAFQTAPPCLALAAFNDEVEFKRVTAETRRNGAASIASA